MSRYCSAWKCLAPRRVPDGLLRCLTVRCAWQEEVNLKPEPNRVVPERLLESGVLPVRVDGNTLYLAMADATDVLLLDDIAAVAAVRAAERARSSTWPFPPAK